MGDSEASSSPLATKRPAEGDPGGSGQTPAPKQAKVKKSNSTSIHEEFDRYTYTDRGGKQRTGSKCKVCAFEMKDTNSTNLKFHVQRKHPDIYDKVVGKIHLRSIFSLIFFSLSQHVIRHFKSPSRTQSRHWGHQQLIAYWFLRRSREREKHRFVDLDSKELLVLDLNLMSMSGLDQGTATAWG